MRSINMWVAALLAVFSQACEASSARSDRSTYQQSELMTPDASQTARRAPDFADITYETTGIVGDPSKYTLDLFIPDDDDNAPLIIFIHGGAWAVGDKRGGLAGQQDAFLKEGMAYASINYPLHPDVRPDQMAQSAANAIAFLTRNSERFGYDPDRIGLIGHSAGAHLAALLAADPRYLKEAGVAPNSIDAVVLLDGAGYDIPLQIESGQNSELFQTIFGTDPLYLERMSPTRIVRGNNPPPVLAFYVAHRRDSEVQSTKLAAAVSEAGGEGRAVAAMNKTHRTINREFGLRGDAVTEAAMAFFAQHLRPD